MEQQDLI